MSTKRSANVRRIAYTTVLTMMQVLERKGHLEVSRDQRAHVYRPTSTRQRALRDMVRDFVDRVFGGAAEPLVQHLIRDHRLTEADVREIARHLKKTEQVIYRSLILAQAAVRKPPVGVGLGVFAGRT